MDRFTRSNIMSIQNRIPFITQPYIPFVQNNRENNRENKSGKHINSITKRKLRWKEICDRKTAKLKQFCGTMHIQNSKIIVCFICGSSLKSHLLQLLRCNANRNQKSALLDYCDECWDKKIYFSSYSKSKYIDYNNKSNHFLEKNVTAKLDPSITQITVIDPDRKELTLVKPWNNV